MALQMILLVMAVIFPWPMAILMPRCPSLMPFKNCLWKTGFISDSVTHTSIIIPFAFLQLFPVLTDPSLYYPTVPDIVDIISQERGLTGAPYIPDLDPSTCTCGMCVRLHHDLCENLDNFQMRFPLLVSGS